MGDRKFTLLELHFDGDAQFGGGANNETDEGRPARADLPRNRDPDRLSKGSAGKTALKVLGALGVAVGGALLVRLLAKRLSGDHIPAVELERDEPEPSAE